MTSRRPILVVEDDRDIREALTDLLRLDGYEVIEARNGVEALGLLQNGTEPCLVLLDLMMPVMSGVELIQRIRAESRLAGVKIVVITGMSRASAELAALEVVAVLRKPLEANEFLTLVRKHSDVAALPA